MMSWFDKIKRYHAGGLWTENMVKNAVVKGKITEDEYKIITDKDYEKE